MDREKASPRESREQFERSYLARLATKSDEERASHRQYALEPDDFRTAFERDYTRIIHSRAFRRLRHKTQVFISPQNDHLCTRLEHSLHVASVASTIARALRLNDDLVCAIAAGHDLGHAPFGHEGERCLRKLANDDGMGGFAHETQSLRVVDHLESPYYTTEGHPGLNLTFAVRDGIVTHHGETFEQRLVPDKDKSPDALGSTEPGGASPATLEGCVVRWADKVAYIGRDLDDAYTVGLLKQDDLPAPVKTTLGVKNRDIIHRLVQDIVDNSNVANEDEVPCIAVSSAVHDALNELAEFSKERIYECEKVRAYFGQIRKAIESLYQEIKHRIESATAQDDADLFADELRSPPHEHRNSCLYVLKEFLTCEVHGWRTEATGRLALDFIAGMTDNYLISAFEELFLPRSVV